MERREVYKAIDSERDYQNKMIADDNRPDMIQDFHIGDTISAIQHNLNKSLEIWYKGAEPHEEAMVYIRKIAALCVQAGEKNGMSNR